MLLMIIGRCAGIITLMISDWCAGILKLELCDHTATITSLSFARHPSVLLVSASMDGTLKLWDMSDDGNMIKTLRTNCTAFYGCCWSPDSTSLATVGNYHSVNIASSLCLCSLYWGFLAGMPPPPGGVFFPYLSLLFLHSLYRCTAKTG